MPPTGQKVEIAVLGDSFISGKANGPYGVEPDDFPQDRSCERSEHGVVPRLAAMLTAFDGIEVTIHNRACTGATLDDLTKIDAEHWDPDVRVPGAWFANVGPQIDGVTATTDVVLIDIGANDLHAAALLQCIFYCNADVEIAARQAQLDSLITGIDNVITQVRLRAPDAAVVLMDYPRVVAPSSRWVTNPCLGLVTPAAADLLNQLITEASARIQNLASRTGSGFFPVSETFDGHTQCDVGVPWTHGLAVVDEDYVNGVLVSIPRLPGGTYSLHANNEGHRQWAMAFYNWFSDHRTFGHALKQHF